MGFLCRQFALSLSLFVTLAEVNKNNKNKNKNKNKKTENALPRLHLQFKFAGSEGPNEK
jgi:hypothetical protein